MTRQGSEPHNEPGGSGSNSNNGEARIRRAITLSLLLAALGGLFVAAGVFVLGRSVGDGPAAGDDPGIARRAPVVETAPAVPRYVDVTAAAGIDFRHVNGATGDSLLPETMGGGVAFFDADGDLDPDLLFVDSGRRLAAAAASAQPEQGNAAAAESDTAAPGEDDLPGSLALYFNDGNGAFTRAAATGLDGDFYGMGVAIGDFDGDGLYDVYATAVGANHLYRNLGQGRFLDVTATAGVAGAEGAWSSSAAFVDVDRDDDLDLFVVNYVEWSREIDFEVDYRLAGIGRAYGPPTNYAGSASYLFRNNADGTFTDVSQESGVVVPNPATGQPAGKGLAVIALDVNADDWVDLLVANDTVGNHLLLNRGDGTFREVGTTAGVAFDNTGAATGAMGIDVAWLDDAQTLAVAVGNFANEMSSLYVTELRAGGELPVFIDEAAVSGIGAPSRRSLTFGLLFVDYDLDGRQDLLQVNGHVEDEINLVQPSQRYAQPAQLFWNCGAACARPFVPVPDAVLGALGEPRVGRGAAAADMDGDGDLDLVLTALAGAPTVLRNDMIDAPAADAVADPSPHWVRIYLRDGREESRNRHGFGARVTLEMDDGSRQRRVVTPARSYLSQVEPVASFGLGDATVVDRMVVRWPDGTEQVFTDVAADRSWQVQRGAATLQPVTPGLPVSR